MKVPGKLAQGLINVGGRNQDVDVLGRPGGPVDGHRDSAADRVANLGAYESGRDGVQLRDKIHPSRFASETQCLARE
jgi:hypothetical protein